MRPPVRDGRTHRSHLPPPATLRSAGAVLRRLTSHTRAKSDFRVVCRSIRPHPTRRLARPPAVLAGGDPSKTRARMRLHAGAYEYVRSHLRGAGRNRTDECQICSLVPYHLATAPWTRSPYRLAGQPSNVSETGGPRKRMGGRAASSNAAELSGLTKIVCTNIVSACQLVLS